MDKKNGKLQAADHEQQQQQHQQMMLSLMPHLTGGDNKLLGGGAFMPPSRALDIAALTSSLEYQEMRNRLLGLSAPSIERDDVDDDASDINPDDVSDVDGDEEATAVEDDRCQSPASSDNSRPPKRRHLHSASPLSHHTSLTVSVATTRRLHTGGSASAVSKPSFLIRDILGGDSVTSDGRKSAGLASSVHSDSEDSESGGDLHLQHKHHHQQSSKVQLGEKRRLPHSTADGGNVGKQHMTKGVNYINTYCF